VRRRVEHGGGSAAQPVAKAEGQMRYGDAFHGLLR
jgi:hypothetical protein